MLPFCVPQCCVPQFCVPQLRPNDVSQDCVALAPMPMEW